MCRKPELKANFTRTVPEPFNTMQAPLQIWVIVFAIGAAQALLLALALWQRTVNAPANRLLAAWLAIVGVDLTVKSLYLAMPGPAWLAAYRLASLFPFLYGSMFYLYVRALTSGRGFEWRDLVHLAGYALVVVLTVPLFFLDPAQTTALFARWSAEYWPPAWFNPFLYLYSLSYVLAALASLQRYRKRVRQRRSDADRMLLRWVDAMAIGQIVIWSIAAAVTLARRVHGEYYIFCAVAAWVCVVGWFSLGQPPLVEVRGSAKAEEEDTPAADDDPRFPAVEARLSQLMDGEALYREPALTIGQVARRSGYPEYLVSAVINRRLGGTFWEYISRQRVQAARACLADSSDERTILDIAYACGFTSKSTFNAAFKRLVGQTPSMYRQQQAGSSAKPSPER